jgi:hypothetical protein
VTPVLSIDPGVSGGAALLDDRGSLLRLWAWRERKPCKRRPRSLWEVSSSADAAYSFALSLHGVGELIRGESLLVLYDGGFDSCGEGSYLLSVEDLFTGKGLRSSLVTAEAAGLLYGPLLACSSGLVRPHPSHWRSVVLGRKRWTSATADAACKAFVAAKWPGVAGELAESAHACEAAAMGWCVWQEQQREVE